MLFFKTPPVSGGGSGRGRTGAGSLGGDCGDCLGVGLTPPLDCALSGGFAMGQSASALTLVSTKRHQGVILRRLSDRR